MSKLQEKMICNVFVVFVQISLIWRPSLAFAPSDNTLINCGSPIESTVDNRAFVGDVNANTFRLHAAQSISLKEENPSPDSSPIYQSARMFTMPSRYEFHVKTRGTHFIRLHFSPFSAGRYNLSTAVFSVSANGFVLLDDFAVADDGPLVKEYIINVETEKVDISFIPSCKTSSFAFINAIELVSAPKDLILDVARLVDRNDSEDFHGLSKQSFETVYRLNVGGSKVTPFNDTLWRTWIPDENYLELPSSGKVVSFSGRINYQEGGATREIAPDSVYRTAREMNTVDIHAPDFNITWVLPASLGYKYLVRMHFCDIVSLAVNELFFNVYINGHMGFKDFDLSAVDVTNQRLASPYYMDFIVEPKSSGLIYVSIGPSRLSASPKGNAILNGLEIMKMNNSMGSFDGKISVDLVLKKWPKQNMGFWMCSFFASFAIISMSLVGYMMVSRRRAELRKAAAWSPLPMDAEEGNLTDGKHLLSGKLVYY